MVSSSSIGTDSLQPAPKQVSVKHESGIVRVEKVDVVRRSTSR